MCLDYDVIELLDELIGEGRLVEVEYVLPAMSYRVKSLLFPAGTEIFLKGSSENKRE